MSEQQKAELLVVCAMHRDRRELDRLGLARCTMFHEYASDQLEQMAGTEEQNVQPIEDPEVEMERLVADARAAGVRGVLSTDDYPGSALAAIVADRLGLPGPSPQASLLAQHKYYARLAGRAIAPEQTPEFSLSSGEYPPLLDRSPIFVKPCKSFFSIGAKRIHHASEWAGANLLGALPPAFFDIFDRLARDHAGLTLSARHLLVERFVSGAQSTVEGIRQRGRTHILGVVDSVFWSDRPTFACFEYPSSLPKSVQERMAAIATRIIEGIGYDDGGFNIEMMWDEDEDRIWWVEINPRSSSQFADLFEKVDGVNTYALLADIALGRPVQPPSGSGRYAIAASFVLRRARDARVLAIPSAEDIAALEKREPGARVEIFVAPGGRLSDEMQDGESYRYAIVDLGADSRDELPEKFAAAESMLPFVFDDDDQRPEGRVTYATKARSRQRRTQSQRSA